MFIARRLALRSSRLSQRRYFSEQQPDPNMIQEMPEYHEALELASEKKFDESLAKLQQTLDQIESQVGSTSPFHLFLYQRMASIYTMKHDLNKVEECLSKCVTVAEDSVTKGNKGYNFRLNSTQNVWLW